MKKRNWLFLLILIPFNVFAKSEFNISCDKTDKVNINEQIICRVSVNSDFLFDNIKFEIKDSDNFEIIDIRSNYEKKWDVTNEANVVNAKTKDLENGLQEFAILLIKAIKSGENDIELSNIELINSNSKENKTIEDVSAKIKVISTDNLLTGILIDGKELEDFSPEKNSYVVTIHEEKSIKVEATSSNEYAKITGDGEIKLSESVKEFYLPITVISEDNVSKIYTIKAVRDPFEVNGIDKKLDSLSIKDDKGNNIIFGFKPDTYEYTIETSMDTKTLDIKPELTNKSVSFVKNYGSQKINLLSGNNVAIIKVQDNEGQVLNYVINIVKPIANKSANNYIKELKVEGYNLKFNKRIKNYTLYIDSKDTKLDITPILESDKAKYSIIDNKDLKAGSVVKIVVTAENEEKTVYNINIKIKESHTKFIILLTIIGLIILSLVYKFRRKLLKLIKGLIRAIKKIRLPKIKVSKIRLPKVKLPKISIKFKKINLSFLKKIKLPKVDIKKWFAKVAEVFKKTRKKKEIINNKKTTPAKVQSQKLNTKKQSPSKKKSKGKKKGKTNYKNKKKK